MLRVSVFYSVVCLALLSCDSPEAPSLDASILGDAGTFVDAGECAPVSASIGPDGGVLSTCGATLTIPAGALSESRTFGIEPIAIPTDGLVFDFGAAAAYAYRFTPDDANLGFHARIRMAHNPLDTHEHIVAVYRSVVHPEGWYPIPHCAMTEVESEAVVGLLGTFSTLRRSAYYPVGPVGLGTGTMDATFNGLSTSCVIETSFSGFAISAVDPMGTRQLRARCDALLVSGEPRISLTLSFTIDAEGAAGPVQLASWQAADESAMWVYSGIDPAHSAPSEWSIVETGSHITGTLMTELWNGAEHHPLTLTFDTAAAPYRERVFDDPVCE